GVFDNASGASVPGLACFNIDGSIDPAGVNLPAGARIVHNAAMAPDGGLFAEVLVGSLGVGGEALIHVTTAGQVDPGFNPGATLNAQLPLNTYEAKPHGLIVQSNLVVVWD